MSKRSGIQLAYPMEERRLTDPKFGWCWPVIVQPKLNGERCRATLKDGKIVLLSSECNEIVSVPHINEHIQSTAHLLPYHELDGELYVHGWDFNEIHSVVSRKSNETRHEKSGLMEFHLFDIVSNSIQLKRLSILQDFYREYLRGPVRLVLSKVAYNMSDIMKIYDRYLNHGYEGIIVRHIKSPYIKKHSRFMLKFKPKKDDYYEIAYATEAISKNGVPLGMIGAFECRDLEGTAFGIGAGRLTHDERRNLWKDRQSLIGKFCHVQYQSISPRGAPLFGLCIDITDENPEESSGGGIL